MTTHIATDLKANLVGSGWMIASMAVFAVDDAFIKAASVTLPVGQVLVIFGLGGALVFASLALYNREPLYSADVISRPMWIRVVFEIIGRLFYVLALSLIPLSAATVILQAAPLVVVAGAALVFGEKVGWRRWSAIGVGFVGVLIILQPSGGVFDPWAIVPLVSAVMFAVYGLLTRYAGRRDRTATSFFWTGVTGAIAMTAIGIWYWEPMSPPDRIWMGALCLTGALGHWLLIRCYEAAEASAVQPFASFQLVFASAMGMAVFGETLRANVAIGAAIIVAAGLFTLWRERTKG